MITIKDPEQWDHLTKTIGKALNFDCSQYSKNFLMRRVEVRLRAKNIDSYLSYALLLEKNTDEQKALDKELTIHVTNFFRDAEVFELFKEKVIPFICKSTPKGKILHIWCAGCSTGEEPLTIATCFEETSKLYPLQYTLLGTDMDPTTVSKAQAAIYEEIQFREMPKDYKEKYFSKQSGGTWKAKPELLKNITYKTGDILKPDKPKNLDIIFCRNTVIYFDIPTKSKLYEEFFDCLNSGGFFIMGKTEIIQGPARDKFEVFDPKERMYRKS